MPNNKDDNNQDVSDLSLSDSFDQLLAGNKRFDSNEINWLMIQLDSLDHPHAEDLIELLSVVQKFLVASRQSEMRNSPVSNEDMLEKLNVVGKTFTETQKKINHTTANPDSGIVYAREYIEKQLSELEKNNDRIFQLYQQTDNKLKKYLKSHR
jgi:hypothetical protein